MKANASCCRLIELRQYTLHPGQRDVLIDLFDREFVETQEAVGMAVIGQFRDLDRPDRFVWLRGFKDVEARGQGLAAFYDGPLVPSITRQKVPSGESGSSANDSRDEPRRTKHDSQFVGALPV
jgi:NIPSNAP